METNVRYTIAGAFVIVLLTAITLGVIWLSAGFSVETYDIYKVYMKESVSGLAVDAPVEFNGVNVGTVRRIQISQRDPKLVELLLRVRSSTPITQATRATMNMRGLTGVTFISLRDQGTDERKIPTFPGEEYPVIQTSPSFITRFDTALTELSQSLRSVSTSIQELLSKENINLMKDIMINIHSITKQLSPLLIRGLNTIDVFNRETLPATNQALINMDNIISNITKITTEMKTNPSVIIRGKEPQPLGPGEQ